MVQHVAAPGLTEVSRNHRLMFMENRLRHASSAPRALDAAQRYAMIAPGAPHALHMPSHTFTRVGLWQESIATNLASAAAARQDNAASEELHALDYQVYAYLQMGP